MSFNRKAILILVISVMIATFTGCSLFKSKTSEVKSPSDFPPAPTALMNATLSKTDGSSFKLADYKGKVVLVNVWATWCGPCRHEVPELVKLQDELHDKGFEVIGLNLDEGDSNEMITEFGKEFEINYSLAKGEDQLFEEFYNVSKKNAIPQSFLIDREGKLVGVFVGGGGALKRLIDSSHKITAD